jgi:hypothetical protein
MSCTVTFKKKTSSLYLTNTLFCVWVYEVELDDAAGTAAEIRLGFSAHIPIEDPAKHPEIARLAGTKLVKMDGAAIQFVSRKIDAAGAGTYEVALLAPCDEDEFTPVMLIGGDAAVGKFEALNFGVAADGVENITQVLEGPSAAAAADLDAAKLAGSQPNLPYASEPFGVYQPLIGWRSELGHERLARAVTHRVMKASRLIGRVAAMTDDRPIGTVREQSTIDRTGTQVGRRLAALVSGHKHDWSAILRNHESSPLVKATSGVLKEFRDSTPPPSLTRMQRSSDSAVAHRDVDQEIEQEASMATTLQYLGEKAPDALSEMFRPGMSGFARVIASVGLFTENHPAKSAFLSPIGILHLFREYFFQLGTFLGPPVGHVWISPGGTVELVEVNTRRVLVERTTEQSTETVSKSELDETNKDELSDAVKTENANDMKLGVGATASGGVTGIFQASGSASFNLDVSRKQAQEQTHKKMREQSAKLSSEVRQNFKTTFRTVTETTDTSSRRYVLQNTSPRLVSYELSRKMRKVAVQVQDLGERLCWQLYVDNPGDPLGTGEFVHATAAALDPGLKVPEQKPYAANQQKTFSSALPFIQIHGGDDDTENTYETSGDNADHGIFEPDVGKSDIIQFKFDVKCPPAPPGFSLTQVSALDFHGAEVKWDPNLNVDIANQQFTIRLTFANFGGKTQLPYDATLVYEQTKDGKDAIDKENAASKAVYDDQVAQAKEKQFYETLRTRLKLVGQVRPRPQDDLREEERTMVYRSIIARLYGSEAGWTNDDYHVASEMIRYFFDVDSMLYFVAPDWWRPRHQQLSSMNDKGELQPTIIAEPALSDRLALQGKHFYIAPGHRPYYLITEETTPAPLGSSLGWLIQLDGDVHRNAFLNSPWVKAVLPIRPGRERDAISFLQRPEVAATDGLDEDYPFDAANDPAAYKGLTIKEVLFKIADKIADEYKASLTPVKVDPTDVNSKLALPTETVFAHGFDPLEGGIAFGADAFKVFSQWIEVLPTDQVVATEYSLKGL